MNLRSLFAAACASPLAAADVVAPAATALACTPQPQGSYLLTPVAYQKHLVAVLISYWRIHKRCSETIAIPITAYKTNTNGAEEAQ